MKKIALLLALASIFLSVPYAHASEDFSNWQGVTIPFSYNGHSYQNVSYFAGIYPSGNGVVLYDNSDIYYAQCVGAGCNGPLIMQLFFNYAIDTKFVCNEEFTVCDPATSWKDRISGTLVHSNLDFGYSSIFTTDIPAAQLTVILNPVSGGTVTSNPVSNFTCSSGTCTGNFSGSVSLTANPASGCTFAYWDDGVMCSMSNPLTVSISSAETITSVFVCSLKWPLSGAKGDRTILLGFGADWVDSCGGQVMKHAGIDVSATAGEDVNAAADGVITEIYTGQHEQWADAIVIKHSSNSFTTVYWHVNATVSLNDSVAKGDKIGTVANLGSNTHFHFGIRENPFVSGKSDKGALPQSSCSGNPAFPEYFVDPGSFTYE